MSHACKCLKKSRRQLDLLDTDTPNNIQGFYPHLGSAQLTPSEKTEKN